MGIEGIIGRKLGMTQVFDGNGKLQAVTVIEAGPCYVTQVKSDESDGYSAVQLGFGEVRRLNSPAKGHLRQVGKHLKHLREFKVDEAEALEVGRRVDAGLFAPGDRVDITGTSKGRGFAGGVKRHGFAGGPKTHGQSDRQRAPGSIGATTFPGRVLKGTRMAGQMGNCRTTVLGLEVLQADAERNLLQVKGAVPGAVGGLLVVRKSARGG